MYFPCLDLNNILQSAVSIHWSYFFIHLKSSTFSLPVNLHFLFRMPVFPYNFNVVPYSYPGGLTIFSSPDTLQSLFWKSVSHFKYHIEQKDQLIYLFWLSFCATSRTLSLPPAFLSTPSLRLLFSTFFPLTCTGSSVQFSMTFLPYYDSVNEFQAKNLIIALS